MCNHVSCLEINSLQTSLSDQYKNVEVPEMRYLKKCSGDRECEIGRTSGGKWITYDEANLLFSTHDIVRKAMEYVAKIYLHSLTYFKQNFDNFSTQKMGREIEQSVFCFHSYFMKFFNHYLVL